MIYTIEVRQDGEEFSLILATDSEKKLFSEARRFADGGLYLLVKAWQGGSLYSVYEFACDGKDVMLESGKELLYMREALEEITKVARLKAEETKLEDIIQNMESTVFSHRARLAEVQTLLEELEK